MQLDITHTTCFEYDRRVEPLLHLLYLRPRENPLLRVDRFGLNFSPNARVDWMRDDFDNLPASVRFTEPAARLEIRSNCSVTTADTPPFDFMVRDYARTFPFAYEQLHRFNLGIYLDPPDLGTQAALIDWIKKHCANRPLDTVAWLFALSKTLSETIRYQRREEPGIQSPLATIGMGSGTCRDYAELFVALVRTQGLAARFVSGYLFDPTLEDSGGDMHAWAEVFLPGAGWRAIDPTYGIFCTNSYVPVAHAVLAESVSPVQGSFFSAVTVQAKLTAQVSVRRAPHA